MILIFFLNSFFFLAENETEEQLCCFSIRKLVESSRISNNTFYFTIVIYFCQNVRLKQTHTLMGCNKGA